jgi:hypothetical protein
VPAPEPDRPRIEPVDPDVEPAESPHVTVISERIASASTFLAVSGAGPRRSALLGSRCAAGRGEAVTRGEATVGSEAAVEAALRWLRRHQGDDGMWDCQSYWRGCVDRPRCEPGAIAAGDRQTRVAMTGLALQCFLAAGHHHLGPGPYAETVARGLRALLAEQSAGGAFGATYEHAIATAALLEALAMSRDVTLCGPADRAVAHLQSLQNVGPDGARLGWDYDSSTGRNDTSVTGWVVMALKDAPYAGIAVDQTLAGARAWFARTWALGRRDMRDERARSVRFHYRWTTEQADPKPSYGWLVPVGLCCACFLDGDGDALRLLGNATAGGAPRSYPCDTYRLYASALGLFQLGDARWRGWFPVVRDALVGAQRAHRGCLDGSWDPQDTGYDQYSRLFSTTLCCLTLEVPYRYARHRRQR